MTFCTVDRKPLLSRICQNGSADAAGGDVGRDAHIAAPLVWLLPAGEILDGYIQNIPVVYSDISVDHYVIMPNHVHLLLAFHSDDAAMRASRPTGNNVPLLSSVIRSLKTLTTKTYGRFIFQSSFHDHVIRNETDYLDHWSYIDGNPSKWTEDEYYTETQP